MRTSVPKILTLLLLAAVIHNPLSIAAADLSKDTIAVTAPEMAPKSEVPSLEKIIPLATQLTGRLAVLENQIAKLPDIPEMEKQYAEVDSNLREPARRLDVFRTANRYANVQVEELLDVIKKESILFDDVSKANAGSIRELQNSREEWQGLKNSWTEWRKSFVKEGTPAALTAAFDQADKTIEGALNLIHPKLNAMLTAQQNATSIQSKILALSTAADNMILTERRDAFQTTPPPDPL